MSGLSLSKADVVLAISCRGLFLLDEPFQVLVGLHYYELVDAVFVRLSAATARTPALTDDDRFSKSFRRQTQHRYEAERFCHVSNASICALLPEILNVRKLSTIQDFKVISDWFGIEQLVTSDAELMSGVGFEHRRTVITGPLWFRAAEKLP